VLIGSSFFVTQNFIKLSQIDRWHLLFILFIMKFVQLGTQIKTRCEKRKYTTNTKNEHYKVRKNHVIKSTSDSLNSEI